MSSSSKPVHSGSRPIAAVGIAAVGFSLLGRTANAGQWRRPAACCPGNSPDSIAAWAVCTAWSIGRWRPGPRPACRATADPVASLCPTTCRARSIAAWGSRMRGSGLVANAQAMKFQARTASLVLPAASNCLPNCSATVRPLLPRHHGQQEPKTLFALAILALLETAGRPAIAAQPAFWGFSWIASCRHLMASSGFLRTRATLAMPKQALAEVVDRLPVLDAFRSQLHDFPEMDLGLVEVVQRQ